MNKLMIATALVLVSTFANAQTAAPTYQDVIRTCGAEWRESDARKAVVKGEGAAKWNEFRAECVARKGYVTKAARAKDMVRVPDKAN
jgi:hypothetical protein